ncbi:MAG: hypothetical protein JO257_26040, partial [Deltaproteobacteria bacterium]|nr:hypothetical protein [Deltaproteobacteria bacterium]
AEARVGGDDLDFDSQVLDGYKPTEGAPGPEQAPLWEDVDQPEADVAAALHMELAELRALRTPVPVRPSGMHPVSGASALMPAETGDHADEDAAPPTNPVKRMKTEEIEGEGDEPATQPVTPPPPKPTPAPMPRVEKIPPPLVPSPAPRMPTAPGPAFGAALLQRSGSSKLPWAIVVALAVAVASLVAYIVMK